LKGQGCGLLIIVSAPSGAGKTTLIRRVMERLGGLRFSVSYTTRLPRANEVEGKDYCFVSPSVFQRMIDQGKFIEWAEVLGNRYGTVEPDMESLSSERTDLLLDIDVQGARKILCRVKNAISIFVLPPRPEVLRKRLVDRRLDTPETIERRLAHAREEVREASWYQYVIVNESLDESVETLGAIILAERYRKKKRCLLEQKIEEWEAC